MTSTQAWKFPDPDLRPLPFSISAPLIFQDVYAQVLEMQSAPLVVRQASNGLRIRIGGKNL